MSRQVLHPDRTPNQNWFIRQLCESNLGEALHCFNSNGPTAKNIHEVFDSYQFVQRTLLWFRTRPLFSQYFSSDWPSVWTRPAVTETCEHSFCIHAEEHETKTRSEHSNPCPHHCACLACLDTYSTPHEHPSSPILRQLLQSLSASSFSSSTTCVCTNRCQSAKIDSSQKYQEYNQFSSDMLSLSYFLEFVQIWLHGSERVASFVQFKSKKSHLWQCIF